MLAIIYGLTFHSCLPKSYDLLARVTVLDDEITCVSGKLVVLNGFRRGASLHDFVDVNKIGKNIVAAVFAGNHGLVYDLRKIPPLGIVQHSRKLAGKPMFASIGSNVFNVLEAFPLWIHLAEKQTVWSFGSHNLTCGAPFCPTSQRDFLTDFLHRNDRNHSKVSKQ